MAKPDDYLRRLSAYYRSKPKFNATVAALCGASAGLQDLYGAMPAAFDLDLAVGVQLDAVGRWVGPVSYTHLVQSYRADVHGSDSSNPLPESTVAIRC